MKILASIILLSATPHCLILGDAAQAQSVSSPAQPSTPDVHSGQNQRAVAAMQDSLARQQAAADRQRQALSRQKIAFRPQEPDILELAAASSKMPAASGTLPETAAAIQSAFFARPWPGALPLSVPNIQTLDSDCESLSTNEVDQLARDAAQHNGLDPSLLKSVMRQESGFKPCALSLSGAMGLMQLMPETAEFLHVNDPYDAVSNVNAGAKFLKMMLDRYQGDLSLALGAYNAGPAKVDKAGGVPQIPETKDYVAKVLSGIAETN